MFKKRTLVIIGAMTVALSQSLAVLADDFNIVTMDEDSAFVATLLTTDLKVILRTPTIYPVTGLEELAASTVDEQFGGAVLAYTDNSAAMNYHGPTDAKLTLDADNTAVDTIPQRVRAVPFGWRC